MDIIDNDIKLIIFFVATAMTIVSSHIGLVRLMANVVEKEKLKRELPGVLIIVEFALVILVCAPLPIAMKMLSADDKFDFFIPSTKSILVVMALLTLADLVLIKFGQPLTGSETSKLYYSIAAIIILVLCVVLFLVPDKLMSTTRVQFFASLLLPLAVLILQFLKSALRLCGILI